MIQCEFCYICYMGAIRSYSSIFRVQGFIVLVFYGVSMISLSIPLVTLVTAVFTDHFYPLVLFLLLYTVGVVVLGSLIHTVSYIPFHLATAFDPIKNDIAAGRIREMEDLGKRITQFTTDFFNFAFLDIRHAYFHTAGAGITTCTSFPSALAMSGLDTWACSPGTGSAASSSVTWWNSRTISWTTRSCSSQECNNKPGSSMHIHLPYLLLIAASCLIIWRSSDGFEMASDYLGRKLPLGIKGATINAIASSMPEFLTTLFFLFYLNNPDGYSGGLGVTSGSALFNLLIIPAGVVLMLFAMGRRREIRLNRKVLLREGVVLLISQVLFINFLFKGKLTPMHGLALVGVYVVYLALLYMIFRRNRNSGDPGFTTPQPRRIRPLWWRILTGDITHTVLNGKPITTGKAWVMLVISTGIMTLGTWLLVFGTDHFGEATGIPVIFVAVVLSAAATSIPDTIISLRDARKGNYDDAISNALGSNIFDIAFALGMPLFLYGMVSQENINLPDKILDFTQEVWVFLLIATFLALAVMLIGKKFSKRKAVILLAIYVAFLLFVGTQANREGFLADLGDPIKNFLTSVADWIGGEPFR
jgi:Ca2+/Na+ antiporter